MSANKSPPKGVKTVTNSIQVMVRCRPFNKREKDFFASKGKEERPVIEMSGPRVTLLDSENDYQPVHAFEYNECFWSCVGHNSPNGMAGQLDVYEKTGAVMLQEALEGFNCCIFAYGQTGSGKTYSMLGAPDAPGVSYLLIRSLFEHIDKEKQTNPGTNFTVKVSFMEIYNEQVRDLFNKKAKAGEYSPVKIRQHPVEGVRVEGLLQITVNSAKECEQQMERGVSERALAETKMNATSSRSHAICQICIDQANAQTGLRRNATINLVDLAGSERLKMTGAQGAQVVEAKNINQSLSTLRKVFDVLIENSKKKTKQVPPYRESMLTWVLKESLGGNSRTMMIAALSPCEENYEDTLSTLRYAQKAKSIVNKVIQNEQPTAKMVSNLKEQVEQLQKQLQEKVEAGGISETAREQIREQYEEEIAATQQALKEAEEVERCMKEKQEELKLEVQDLRQGLDAQKKQKFSAAFRSAFMIKREKTEMKALYEKIRNLESTVTSLQRDKVQLTSSFEDQRKGYESAVSTLEKTLNAKSAEVAELRNKESSLSREVHELRGKLVGCECEALRERLKLKEEANNSLSKRYQALDDEYHRLKDLQQRDKAQLLTLRDEASAKEDAMRAARDSYKKQYLMLQKVHEADTKIIEELVETKDTARRSARRNGDTDGQSTEGSIDRLRGFSPSPNWDGSPARHHMAASPSSSPRRFSSPSPSSNSAIGRAAASLNASSPRAVTSAGRLSAARAWSTSPPSTMETAV